MDTKNGSCPWNGTAAVILDVYCGESAVSKSPATPATPAATATTTTTVVTTANLTEATVVLFAFH
jgi:hypothetical protein